MMSRISAMKKTLLVIVVLGGTMAGYGFYDAGAVDSAPDVGPVAVTVGDIVDTVGATGTLEAVTTVQGGSQVSGTIQELYVDFNSIVRKGDVLMRLDPSLFETQLEQVRANLLRSEAEVERLSVAVDDAVAQLRRARELAASDLISETELETAEVSLRSAEAQIKSADAELRQSQASLSMNEVNLEHTVIRAPIDGMAVSPSGCLAPFGCWFAATSMLAESTGRSWMVSNAPTRPAEAEARGQGRTGTGRRPGAGQRDAPVTPSGPRARAVARAARTRRKIVGSSAPRDVAITRGSAPRPAAAPA